MARVAKINSRQGKQLPPFEIGSLDLIAALERIFGASNNIKIEITDYSSNLRVTLEGFGDLRNNVSLIKGSMLIYVDGVCISIEGYRNSITYEDSDSATVGAILSELSAYVPFYKTVGAFIARYSNVFLTAAALMFYYAFSLVGGAARGMVKDQSTKGILQPERNVLSKKQGQDNLVPRLRTHSQNKTTAARAQAERNRSAHRS